MPSPSLESALVRILRGEGELLRPVGAGFLVSPQHIITCAHVVNSAFRPFRLPKNAAKQTNAEILVDFPLLTTRPLIRTKILHWFPVQEDSSVGEIEDIAVLELLPDTSLPDEARPAPLVLPHEQAFFNKRVRLCGFPVGVDNGTYANGVLQGLNAKGWVEIHHQSSEQIEAGFSGTAIWSAEENAAFGMTVSILHRQNARVAYMIPAVQLIKAFPDLDQHSRPANPYRGLEAFREKDADLYFGRKKTIKRLKQVVADRPFAAVIGASGSGKSSVVFAGLLPTLRKSGDWLIAHCRPKKEPFYELSACLIPLLYDDPILRSEKTDELKEKFHTGSVGLVGIIRQIREQREQHENLHLLLVIDQFEELFTLNTDQELIRQYIGILLECLRTEQFTVLLTMRADFFAAAVSSPALAEALDNSAPIILPQIDEQGLREVVEQPANVLGVYFEPGLTDLIVSDVGNEPGSLPLLEFCLTQLWERQEFRRISHDAYKAIGGVQQALANHADAVYAEFDEQEREQLRHIFLKLVRPGQGTEDTRQVATVGQIPGEYRGLITRLADKRLIVTGRDEERGEETVEVVHEALIRRWQTLRQWVNEERGFLVWKKKLSVFQEQWGEKGKDEGALLRSLPLDEALKWRGSHAEYLEKKELKFVRASEQFRERKLQERKAVQKEKARQQKRNISALLFGLTLAVLFLLMVVYQQQEIKRNAKIAEQERQHTVEQRGIAEQQTLAANYNLSKAFEEKALTARNRNKAQKIPSNRTYQQAILFASASLYQEIKSNHIAIKPDSVSFLFAPEMFRYALMEESVFLFVKSSARPVISAAFSPDGKKIATASEDWLHQNNNFVQLWDTESTRELIVLKGHNGPINCISFNPDGKSIASASDDNTIRLWDIHNGKLLNILKGHKREVLSISFSPTGNHIASASNDETIRLWNTETGEALTIFTVKEDQENNIKDSIGTVTSVTFSPNGKKLASTYNDQYLGEDNTIRLWDTETAEELAVFKGHKKGVTDVDFSPDGKTIVSASMDKTVRLWDVETAKELAVFKGHEEELTDIEFNPNGKTIASASMDKTIRLWDVEHENELIVLEGHEEGVTSIAFRADGEKIISASRDKTTRTWNVKKSKEATILKGHEGEVHSVSFSPNGIILGSASSDNTVRLWDVNTGKVLTVFEGHENDVVSLAFSPDGKKIVSASEDYTVRLWDVESYKESMIFKGHKGEVHSVAFSPDGTLIGSSSAILNLATCYYF